MEQWGQWVSIGLGLYYAYQILRSVLIALFSCHTLYREHGVSPSLLWGMGLGRELFPLRFYKRWRRFQATQRRTTTVHDLRRHPSSPMRPLRRSHEYIRVQSETGRQQLETYKSYKSGNYLTLDRRSAQSPRYPVISERPFQPSPIAAQIPLQPLVIAEPTPAPPAATAVEPFRPPAVPVPPAKDSIDPPGPLGDAIRTTTLPRK